MGGLLVLISMAAGTVSFISLIRPLPGLWLPTRRRAAIVWIASFVLFYAGDSLIPRPTVPHPTSAGQPEEEWSNARTGYASFQQRLAAGADCQELYEIRNEVRRLDQSYANRMNEDLRAIGCYSSTSSRTPYESIPSTVRELTDTQVDSEATGVLPCIPRKLSEAAIELVRLYDQLHAFKDDHEFIRLGFGRGGRYFAWLQAIQRYQDTNSGFELLDELGFIPGDVMLLGMNYVGENLSDSDLSLIESSERKIQTGLALTRCNEIDSNWRETIQASLEARQSYAAEAEAQVLARESRLGRPLTDEERLELSFARLRDILGVTAREDEELALAELRPLIDQMRAIGEQRKREYEVALVRFGAAAAAAEQGHGTWTAALTEGETVVALAKSVEAELSTIATKMADLEAMAPPEVAALAATGRRDTEQAVALFGSVLVGLQDQLELMRALVAELTVAEHSTPSGLVTQEMMDDAILAIKNSDDSIVEVGLGGRGKIEDRQRTIHLEVLRETSVLQAKELGENAVRIVERLWSEMVPADYTIVVTRTGPPLRSGREYEERIIVEGSKGRFESDISWR